MKIRRPLLAVAAVAGLALTTTACDAEYYGGYSALDGQYWRNKGICNMMSPYGAIVGSVACYYPRTPAPADAVQTCMTLAVGAFPSRGYDGVPQVYWLAALCGASGGVAGYWD